MICKGVIFITPYYKYMKILIRISKRMSFEKVYQGVSLCWFCINLCKNKQIRIIVLFGSYSIVYALIGASYFLKMIFLENHVRCIRKVYSLNFKI